jgi:hypothetical protein
VSIGDGTPGPRSDQGMPFFWWFYKERNGEQQIFQYPKGRVDEVISLHIFRIFKIVLTVDVQKEGPRKVQYQTHDNPKYWRIIKKKRIWFFNFFKQNENTITNHK